MRNYDKESRAFNLAKFNAKHRMFKVYLDKKEDAALIEHLDQQKNKSKAIRQLLKRQNLARAFLIGKRAEQRPQGEWIFKKFDEKTGISNSDWCPFCGKVKAQVYDNFCGNCGASMIKGGEK